LGGGLQNRLELKKLSVLLSIYSWDYNGGHLRKVFSELAALGNKSLGSTDLENPQESLSWSTGDYLEPTLTRRGAYEMVPLENLCGR
jgi:hypothetical protein